MLQRLQVIQNTAARCVTGVRRSEHMIPILRDLHWLPVRRRITFKTAVLVCKCLHDRAPQYLQTYCEPTSTVATRRLQSGSLWPTDCSMHQSKLRRPQFRRPRTSCMEQTSCCTARTRHYTDNVQEQTEDIFVQCVTVHTAHLQLSSDSALYKCS